MLLCHLDKLRQDIVTLGAVLGKLVAGVALEHICACNKELFDDLKVVAMRGQMKCGPLVEATLSIQIKCFHALVLKHLVQLCDHLDALLLALSYSSMERSPVILISEVRPCTVENEGLCYIVTFLWIFGEEVHNKVEDCLAIVICLVYIRALFDQRLD